MRSSRQGQGQGVARDLGVTSVEEDLDPGFAGPRQLAHPATCDRSRSGEDLTQMDRHMDDVVYAGFKQLQRVLEHLLAAHGDDRSHGALAHRPWQAAAGIAVPQKKGIDGCQIRFIRGLQPVPEFSGGEADRRYTFANEPSNVAVRDALAIINDNIHQSFAPVSHLQRPGGFCDAPVRRLCCLTIFSLPRTVIMVSIFAGSPTHSVPA